jgi:hypothetical protein
LTASLLVNPLGLSRPCRPAPAGSIVDFPQFVAADSNAFSGATEPGVLVPANVQWNFVPSGSRDILSIVTIMSGNVVMNPRASSAIAARPTAGGPSLMLIEPRSAKNAATLSGS